MTNKLICFFKTLDERQVLLLLIGISFGLRLYAVLMAQGIANDSAEYGFIARDFLRADFIKGLSSPAPPFYPFLIYLVSPDTSSVEIAGRFISLFFGTLSIIPLFYLVKGAIGQKEAIFSGLLYAFHPYLVTYSGMLLTEATYWGLLILSVYFFWTGLEKQVTWKIGLAGCFLGLAYLTRPEGIGYVLVYLIWIIVDGGIKKKWLKKSILIATLLLSVLIFVTPYVIYIHQETGQWLISKKALEAQSEFLKKGEEKVDFSKALEQNKPIGKNSKILMIVRNVVEFFPFVIYQYLRAYHFSLWLLLFFGLIRVRQKVIGYEVFVASLVLLHLFSLSTFLRSAVRFSVPVVPLSLFWAGTGILEMKRYLEKIKMPNPEKIVLFVVILVILIQLPQDLKPERRHRADQKKVGQWLLQHTPPDAIIMSNSPQETFYADRKFIALPPESSRWGIPGSSYEKIVHYARTRGVRYILVDGNTHETNPDLVGSIRSTDFREIFKQEGKKLIIYEVLY